MCKHIRDDVITVLTVQSLFRGMEQAQNVGRYQTTASELAELTVDVLDFGKLNTDF